VHGPTGIDITILLARNRVHFAVCSDIFMLAAASDAHRPAPLILASGLLLFQQSQQTQRHP
jgi:hypothetical protein